MSLDRKMRRSKLRKPYIDKKTGNKVVPLSPEAVDALKRQMTREEFEFVELNTFHLGLSFILAAGFLALTLGGR